MDDQIKYMTLEKRLKLEHDKSEKKNQEIAQLKKQLREAQRTNENLMTQLSAHRPGEEDLDVIHNRLVSLI